MSFAQPGSPVKSRYQARSPLYEYADLKKSSTHSIISNKLQDSQLINNSEFEIRKLMNLVELQQHEISNWKRRYQQQESRNQDMSFQSKTIIEYEKHLDQLSLEAKNTAQLNEQLSAQIKKHEQTMEAMRNKELSLLDELNHLQDEVLYQKEQNNLIHEEFAVAQYKKDQQNHSQLQQLQQQNQNHLKTLEEQIKELTYQVTNQKDHSFKLENQNQSLRENEKLLIQQIDSLKQKQLEIIDDHRRNTSNLTLKQIEQNKSQEEKVNNLLKQIDHLEYQISLFDQQNQKLSLLNDDIQIELDRQIQQRESMDRECQNLKISNEQNQNQIREIFERQLNNVVKELQQQNERVFELEQSCQELRGVNEELQINIQNASSTNDIVGGELSDLKQKYDELQQLYDQDITQQNEDIQSLEEQVSQLEEIIQNKNEELDQMRQAKNTLAVKHNDSNVTINYIQLLIQKLQVDIDSEKNKQHQYQLQLNKDLSIHKDISKSQLEQQKRHFDSLIEELQSELRTVKQQLELKTRECEEWKTSQRY